MSTVSQEFIIFSNGNGEAAIIVREQIEAADNPVVLLRNNKAVLQRNNTSQIELGSIDREIIDIFKANRTVLVAEVPDAVFAVSKEKFPTDAETIDCYEAPITEVQEFDSIETSAAYYIMIPEGKQGMILIQSQSGTVRHPVVLFDKKKVLIRRDDTVQVDLGIVEQSVLKDFRVRKKIIVAEVPADVFINAQTSPPKENDFTACYEARIFEVGNVDKEKTTRRTIVKTILSKFVIAMVFLFAVGFGLNQIVPGSNTYRVSSDNENGKKFLTDNSVTYEINNTVKVFFADIHRGKAQFDSINKQTGKKESVSAELVKTLELKPVYTTWTRYGLFFVVGGMVIISLLLTLLSKNLFYRLMPIAEAIVD